MDYDVVSVEEYISKQEAGSSVFCRVQRDGNIRTDFFIREGSHFIREAPPVVTFRPAFMVLEHGDIGVNIMMFKVGENPHLLYINFWNYFCNEVKDCFYDLSSQPDIALHYYGDSRMLERTILTPNPMREFFQESIQSLNQMRPWTWDQFNASVAFLVRAFPDPEGLWRHIGGTMEPQVKNVVFH